MGNVSIVNIHQTEEGLLVEFSNNNSFNIKNEEKIKKAKKKLKIGNEYPSFLAILDLI